MNIFALGGFDPLAMPIRRPTAPKVSLASRSHIESMDAGLSSVLGMGLSALHEKLTHPLTYGVWRMNVGAQEVIKQILARRSVTKLILGHNDLGDSGCEELFGFLNSDAGRNYKITHISLNSNGIGNAGLEAIAEYLEGNEYLRELFLQNVSIT